MDQETLATSWTRVQQGFEAWKRGRCSEALPRLETARQSYREHEVAAGELLALTLIYQCLVEKGPVHWSFWKAQTILPRIAELSQRIARAPEVYVPDVKTGFTPEEVDNLDQMDWVDRREALQRQLATLQSTGNPANSAVVQTELGRAHARLGEFMEAERHLQEALKTWQSIEGPQFLELEATTHHALVEVFHGRQDFRRALRHSKAALAIWQRLGRKDQAMSTLSEIGLDLVRIGDLAGAEVVWQEAYALHERLPPDPVRDASLQFNLATLWHEQGRSTEAAELLQHVLDSRLPKSFRLEGMRLLARVWLDLGRAADAELLLQQATALSRQIDDSPTGDLRAREHNFWLFQRLARPGQTKQELIDTLEEAFRAEDWDEATRASLELVILFGHDRDPWELDELYRPVFDRYQNTQDASLRALMRLAKGHIRRHQGRLEEAFQIAKEALQHVDHQREPRAAARLYGLLVAIAEDQGDSARAEHHLLELLRIYERLRDSLADTPLHSQTFGVLPEGFAGSSGSSFSGDSLLYGRAARYALRRGDKARAFELMEKARVRHRQPVGLAETQQQLQGLNATMVSYFLFEPGVVAQAWILTPKEVIVQDLGADSAVLSRLVRSFRQHATRPDSDAWKTPAQELYERLIAPIQAHVEGSKLVIVPHGLLSRLPYAALRNRETGRALLDGYQITYASSATSFRDLSTKPHVDRPPSFFAFGDPDGSLPHAARMAREASTIRKGSAFVGPESTETRFRQTASQATALHVSTHARLHRTEPRHSHLQLAADGEHDGELRVDEIFEMDMSHVDLLVLSACETAAGTLRGGDDTSSVTRAFLHAGVANVVSTLWPVQDAATSHLMARFYRHLARDIPPAEALRRAQLEARDDRPHPWFWAGFTLTGTP